MKYIVLLCLPALLFATACNKNQSDIVYKSDTLKIIKLTPNTFVHHSYLQTESFGKVTSNGLIFNKNSEAVVFDTPTTDAVSEELMTWITVKLNAEIKAVIATHSHEDCLGGLKAFHAAGIPSYSNQATQQLAREANRAIPTNGFQSQLELIVGGEKISCIFVGEGHTVDNIIGYIPTEKVLFGGCLVKSLGASKGYVGEANVEEWPKTVEKIKNRFAETQHVIPGHGKSGDMELLDYTKELFTIEKKE